MTSLRDLLRLAGLVFVAVSCIVLGDVAGKLLALRQVDPVFIAWTRFALAALVLVPLMRPSRRDLAAVWTGPVLLRGALISAGICCILTALRSEPIANVFGAFFIGPVVSSLLAITFLGESPSRSRSLFLGLGFCGVMLIVKPGFGVSAGMGFALAAGCCYGAYLTMTRMVAGTAPPPRS